MDNFTIFKFNGSQGEIVDYEDRREVDGETLQIGVKHEKEVRDNEGPSFQKYKLVYETIEEVERMEIGRGEIKTRNKFVLSIGDDYELDLVENDSLDLSIKTEENKVAEYSDFLLTSDGYLLVEKARRIETEFIENSLGGNIERVTIDLQTVQEEFESIERLQANFSGYPSEALEAVEITGEGFSNSEEYLRHNEKSILENIMFQIEYQGETTTLGITRKGGVRVYSPFNYPNRTAVRMVSEKIAPHIITQSNFDEFR